MIWKLSCYVIACVFSGLQMYLHLVKVLEDNYPEMMKRMFVINGDQQLIIYLDSINTVPLCKAKRQYLLTLQVSRYCLLALNDSANINRNLYNI